MSIEVGNAHLTIWGNTSQLAKDLGKAVAGGEKSFAKAGTGYGKVFKKNFEDNQPDIEGLRKKLEGAEKAHSSVVERESKKQEAARRKVAIAEAELAEKRENGNVKASVLLKAEEKLYKANVDLERSIVDGSAAIADFASDVDEARSALDSVEKSAGKSVSSFKKMGDAVKSAVKGDFKGAFGGISAKASTIASSVSRSFKETGHNAKLALNGDFKGAFSGLVAQSKSALGGIADRAKSIGINTSTKMADGLKSAGSKIKTAWNGPIEEAGRSAIEKAKGIGVNISSSLGTALKGGLIGVGAAVVGTIGGAITGGVSRLVNIEEAEAKMRAVGFTAAQTDEAMANALESVKGTAFGLGDAATVASSAMASGIEPGKELTSYLKTVGDAAAVAGIPLDEMGAIFNKVTANGKLTTEELNQLGDRGIPALQWLADEYGVTTGELRKMVEEGTVDAQTFNSVMEQNMGGAAKDMGQTTTGAFKNMGAALSRFGATLIEDLYPHVGPIFTKITEWLDKLTESAGPMADTIGTKVTEAIKVLVPWVRDTLVPALQSMWTTFTVQILPKLQEFGNFIRDVIVPAIISMAKWISDNRDTLMSLALIVGSMIVAYKTYIAVSNAVKAAIVAVKVAQLGLNLAMSLNPVGLIIAAIVGLVVAVVLAYNKIGWFRDAVDFAWAKIKQACNAVVVWFRETLVPWFQGAIQKLIDKFNSFKNGVSAAWGWVQSKIDGVKNWFATVLLPFFMLKIAQLRHGFELFKFKLAEIWWNVRLAIWKVYVWFMTTLVPFFKQRIENLKNNFQWFKDKVTGIWGGFKSMLSDGWNWVKNKVFNPMKSWITETVPNAFKTGVEAVKKAWAKIKEAAKTPVTFVIDKVINGGIIDGFNNVLGMFGDDFKNKHKLSHISKPEGWHGGGYTGRGNPWEVAGAVHRDEQVIRSKSRRSIERVAPGLLDSMNSRGAAALEKYNPATMAVGAPVYGGAPSFNHGLAHAIYRTGVMKVSGAAPGYDMTGAINMIDRATSIKVRRGTGGDNTVNVQAGNIPAWWAGYYENNGVRLNNLVAGGMAPASKRILLAHELGHGMGLPHAARMHGGNGAQSMMNYDNMYRHNSVTGADVRALSAIYGGSGKGTSPGESGEDEKGLLGWLIEKVGYGKLFKNITDFDTNSSMGSLVKGMADKLWSHMKSFIGSLNPFASKGDENGAGAFGIKANLYDKGGWLPTGLSLNNNQTGEPEAILNPEQWRALISSKTGEGSNAQTIINVTRDQGEDGLELGEKIDTRLAFLAKRSK